MTAVPTSAATTTINTFKPKVRILEVPLKRELSVKSGDSMKTRPRFVFQAGAGEMPGGEETAA
jgi:hypothetical protein